VIFAIFPKGVELSGEVEGRWPLAEEIFKIDERCMAIIAKPDHYEELINQIHDDLCIAGCRDRKVLCPM